jgi:hypothetical protein
MLHLPFVGEWPVVLKQKKKKRRKQVRKDGSKIGLS